MFTNALMAITTISRGTVAKQNLLCAFVLTIRKLQHYWMVVYTAKYLTTSLNRRPDSIAWHMSAHRKMQYKI